MHALHPRNSLHRSFRWVSLVAVLVATAMPLASTQAANLTTSRDYLNREQGGIATGIQHELFFTTTTAVSGGAGNNKVILLFPNDVNNNSLWCRTAGTLTVTGITDPTGTGAGESATILPGTLTGACTQSTPDTFTISGVNNLTAATKYGVRFVALGAALGTGTGGFNDAVTVKTNNGTTDIDSQVISIYPISNDQVSVTATVNPSLSVTLSGNTAALGTIASGTISKALITSAVVTNAANGYISLVNYSGILTAGGGVNIADAAGPTIANNVEGFGVSTSASAGQTIGTWSPAACTSTGTTSNITALSTTFKSFALNAAPTGGDTTTLCFEAAISGTTKAGSYSTTATLVTTARF